MDVNRTLLAVLGECPFSDVSSPGMAIMTGARGVGFMDKKPSDTYVAPFPQQPRPEANARRRDKVPQLLLLTPVAPGNGNLPSRGVTASTHLDHLVEELVLRSHGVHLGTEPQLPGGQL